MNPRDLGKPVVLSLPDGEATGTLVGYVYTSTPTVDVPIPAGRGRWGPPSLVQPRPGALPLTTRAPQVAEISGISGRWALSCAQGTGLDSPCRRRDFCSEAAAV